MQAEGDQEGTEDRSCACKGVKAPVCGKDAYGNTKTFANECVTKACAGGPGDRMEYTDGACAEECFWCSSATARRRRSVQPEITTREGKMVIRAPAGIDVDAADVSFLLDSARFSASEVATKDLLAKAEGRVMDELKINVDGLAVATDAIEKVRRQRCHRPLL